MKARKPVGSLCVAVAILFLTHTPAKADIILFDADMQGATVATDTDAANLNIGTATGSWTNSAGRSPTDIDLVADGAAKAVWADQDSADPWAPFDLSAGFSSSAVLQDGVEVELDAYIRRVPSSGVNHSKDIHIVGLDGSNNESFHLQLSAAQDSATNEQLRVGYVHSSGILVWDLPGAADADNNLVYDFNAFAASNLRGLKLHINGTQYTISFDHDNDGVYDEPGEWTTDWLAFNGSASTISRVRIYGQSSTSGFFFDNLTARSLAQPPTLALDFESAPVGTNAPPGWHVIGATYTTTNGLGNPGACGVVDAGSTVYLVNEGEPFDATKNISGTFDFYIVEIGNYSNGRFFMGNVLSGLTGTSVGECLQVSLTEKTFAVRAGILGGNGTTLFDGSNNNACEIFSDRWYSATFSWTPTNGVTGDFSFSWGGTEGPMTVTGYTFDSEKVFFGFGTKEGPARFDNISITGKTIGPAGTVMVIR